MECLEKVVGITQRECECFEVPQIPDPENEGEFLDVADPALSHSGYYIDDMEDGIPLIFPASAKDCGDSDLYDILLRSRIEAAQEFVTDFGATLTQFTLPRHAEVISPIGEIKKNVNVPLATTMDDLIGITIEPRRIRGATGTITRIRVRMSAALVNAALSIYSDADDYTTPIVGAITFSAAANVLTEIPLTEPIILPSTDQHSNTIRYAILFDRQGANPYNYTRNCGTGCGKRIVPWSKYAEVDGIYVGATSEIKDFDKDINKTYGLIIDMRWSCKSMDWMCRAHASEWSSLPYFRVIGKVLQLMTVNKLIGYILNSGKLNRYTLVKSEFLMGKRNHNRKEIADRLAWLSENIPADIVDCYQCKATNRMTKGEILV